MVRYIKIILLCQIYFFTSVFLQPTGRDEAIEEGRQFPAESRSHVTDDDDDGGGGDGDDDDSIANEYELRLLKMLGLKQRPSPTKYSKAPAIMQHFYRAHLGDDYERQENLLEDWERGFALPSQAIRRATNTVRSLHHIESDEDMTGSGSGGEEFHRVRLRFNVTELPDEERLHASQLLIHRHSIPLITPDILRKSDHHKISVYEMTHDNGDQHEEQLHGEERLRLIESRLVDSTQDTKWETFNVSRIVHEWKVKAKRNHGFVIGISSQRHRDDNKSTDALKSHVRLRRDLIGQELSDSDWHHQRPILLTYLHDGKKTTLESRTRSRRSSNTSSDEVETVEPTTSTTSRRKRKRDVNARKKNRKRRKRDKSCKRNNLYVDFKVVGWSNWIVAPHGYAAYYCQGTCNFPLSRFMNATNHAVVQTLVNDVDKNAAPKTCCVPTKLGEISMLYLDRSDQVVLKTYPEMVAEECGCR